MWQDTKNIYHLGVSLAANMAHGFPSRKLFNIGVTGTDGKTTTSSMLYHILSFAGLKTAIISTVGAIIDGKVYDTGFHVTNPDGLHIQPYIKQALRAGVKYLIIETTSIGLHQNRVFGIPFKIGILTNITNEHLDYHKDYKNYVKAKARLFKTSETAIVNLDDRSYEYILPYLKNKRVITYGFKESADVNPQKFNFKTRLIGGFNQYNALAAISAAREVGVDEELIRKALLSFTAPTGREEVVYDGDFMVIIDFAHTPAAFEAVLPEIKMMKKGKGRVIHVFGAAGLRDRSKRPEMGRISSLYSDIIILTAEDPRTESIEEICNEIEGGILKDFDKKNLLKIVMRNEAIERAVKIAKAGDIVVLTGKAHEQSMNYGHGEEPWSEHEVVKEALRKIKK